MTRSTLAALALSLPLAAAAQPLPPALQAGLVASYPLDGDGFDQVTRTRATPVATRPFEDRNGNPRGALFFDGVRSAVNLGSALQPARFTLSAWIRPEAVDRVQVVISKIKNLPGHWQRNFELRLEPGGRLLLHVPSGSGWEALTGARTIAPGRWTHVAATYDGARAQLYVDGTPDGAPLAMRYAQSATETWLGARAEGGGRDGRTASGPTFFFGAIDEVRVWDRALAPADVAVLAGRGQPLPPPEAAWDNTPVPGVGDEAFESVDHSTLCFRKGDRPVMITSGFERTAGLNAKKAMWTPEQLGALGKLTNIDEYRVQGRGGKGILTMKRTERTGDVVGLLEVLPEDEMMLITRGGQTLRCSVRDIRATGRVAQGVQLKKLDMGDVVAAIAARGASEKVE